jgi:glycosyltransferase involved in cell wall biosynthesis
MPPEPVPSTVKDANPRSLEQAGAAGCTFSLVICTYNRADVLRDALHSAINQETGGRFTHEVIVVDNNSTDGTRAIVDEMARHAAIPVRYFFEPRQGKSFALNTALEALAGEFYSIVDDDFLLPSDWLAGIHDGIQRHLDASFYSGKVLPAWSDLPPSWLTRRHWSPVAMADYGDEEFLATSENQICLLASTFRTSDVRAVGGYDVRLGVSGTRIGGVEDLEILQRLWRRGKHGVYLPTVEFRHRAEPERVTRRYHRRWHRGHGRSRAMMGDPAIEGAVTLLGVPRYMLRELVENVVRAIGNMLVGRTEAAFSAEARLWFIVGYLEERWAQRRSRHDGAEPQ